MTQHVVESLCHDCHFETSELAWSKQQWLSEFFGGPARVAIAEALDRCSEPNAMWCIDALEVDLGVFDEQDSPEDWAARLRDCLIFALQRLRGETHTNALPSAVYSSEQIAAASFDHGWGRGSELTAFCEYLRRGYLRWSSFRREGYDVPAWVGSCLRQSPDLLWQRLLDGPEGARAMRRLLAQGRPESLSGWLRDLFPEISQALTEIARARLKDWGGCGRCSDAELRQLDFEWLRVCLVAMRRHDVIATGKPKHSGLCTSEVTVGLELRLTPQDRARLVQLIGSAVFEILGYGPLLQSPTIEATSISGGQNSPIAFELAAALSTLPGTGQCLALLHHLGLSASDDPSCRAERAWRLVHSVLLAEHPPSSKRFAVALRALHGRYPIWIEHTLRLWAQHRALRRTWGHRLDGEGVAVVVGVLLHDAEGRSGGGERGAVVESLLASCLERFGDWRGLFVERVVRHCVEGQPLPRDEGEWRRFAEQWVAESLGQECSFVLDTSQADWVCADANTARSERGSQSALCAVLAEGQTVRTDELRELLNRVEPSWLRERLRGWAAEARLRHAWSEQLEPWAWLMLLRALNGDAAVDEPSEHFVVTLRQAAERVGLAPQALVAQAFERVALGEELPRAGQWEAFWAAPAGSLAAQATLRTVLVDGQRVGSDELCELLNRVEPSWLRERLRGWAAEVRLRDAWSEQLEPWAWLMLLRVLNGDVVADEPSERFVATLRQAAERAGLAPQALVAQAFERVALGEELPRDGQWEAFWVMPELAAQATLRTVLVDGQRVSRDELRELLNRVEPSWLRERLRGWAAEARLRHAWSEQFEPSAWLMLLRALNGDAAVDEPSEHFVVTLRQAAERVGLAPQALVARAFERVALGEELPRAGQWEAFWAMPELAAQATLRTVLVDGQRVSRDELRELLSLIEPSWLRERLRGWAAGARLRHAWSEQLEPSAWLMLLRALNGDAAVDEPSERFVATLRQAAERVGLAPQALVAQAFERVALGEELPRAGQWEAFWVVPAEPLAAQATLRTVLVDGQRVSRDELRELLNRVEPSWLRERLRGWAAEARLRHAWSEQLEPWAWLMLLRVLNGDAVADEPSEGFVATLRQAAERVGLAPQALVAQAFERVSLGEELPRAGQWEAFWVMPELAAQATLRTVLVDGQRLGTDELRELLNRVEPSWLRERLRRWAAEARLRHAWSEQLEPRAWLMLLRVLNGDAVADEPSEHFVVTLRQAAERAGLAPQALVAQAFERVSLGEELPRAGQWEAFWVMPELAAQATLRTVLVDGQRVGSDELRELLNRVEPSWLRERLRRWAAEARLRHAWSEQFEPSAWLMLLRVLSGDAAVDEPSEHFVVTLRQAAERAGLAPQALVAQAFERVALGEELPRAGQWEAFWGMPELAAQATLRTVLVDGQRLGTDELRELLNRVEPSWLRERLRRWAAEARLRHAWSEQLEPRAWLMLLRALNGDAVADEPCEQFVATLRQAAERVGSAPQALVAQAFERVALGEALPRGDQWEAFWVVPAGSLAAQATLRTVLVDGQRLGTDELRELLDRLEPSWLRERLRRWAAEARLRHAWSEQLEPRAWLMLLRVLNGDAVADEPSEHFVATLRQAAERVGLAPQVLVAQAFERLALGEELRRDGQWKAFWVVPAEPLAAQATLRTVLVDGQRLGTDELRELLNRVEASWLRERLRGWAAEAQLRHAWSEQLEPWAWLMLLRVLNGDAVADEPCEGFVATLRQAAERVGLAPQALVVQAFERVALGEELPRAGQWEAFWVMPELATQATLRKALVDGERVSRDELRELLVHPPASLTPAQRLALAEAMSDPRACRQWLASTTEAQRWMLLGAFLPRHCESLKTMCGILFGGAKQILGQQPQVDTSILNVEQLHWRFIAKHVFLEGLDPLPEVVTRRYAQFLVPFAGAGVGEPRPLLEGTMSRLHSALQSSTEQSALVEAMCRGLQLLPSLSEAWEALYGATVTEENAPYLDVDGDDVGTERDPLYVGNAGLVLLSPFFERLFSTLGLTQHKIFVDRAASYRAVHLLEYLVHGRTNTHEPAWILNKLLCGIPLVEPLPRCSGLDEATRGVLDDLLRAVIAHWAALGNTSIAGLQETFLRREGRITRVEDGTVDGWRLQIETQCFDVLLDRIPWGYSLIRLPWMEGVLNVEWR